MKIRKRQLVQNPFVSKAQRAYLYANHPDIAAEFEKHTPKGKKLPRRVKNRKLAANARNPLRLDPTRTITLRRAFATQLRKAFSELKVAVLKLIQDEDALGLKPQSRDPFVGNAFCPTGPGGGVDPTCSPAAGKQVPYVDQPRSGSKTPWQGDLPKEGDWRVDPDLGTVSEARMVDVDKLEMTEPLAPFDPRKDDIERYAGWMKEGKTTPPISVIRLASGKLKSLSNRRVLAAKQAGVKQLMAWVDLGISKEEYLAQRPTGNQRWQFHSDPQKLKAFQDWLKAQVGQRLTSQNQEALWHRFIQQGFQKGAARAFDDTKRAQRALAQTPEAVAGYQGSRDEFLRSAFANAETVDKVKMLASRAFDELDNVTGDMSNRMSRVLADGLVRGASPIEIGRALAKETDLSRDRAMTIARTEIIRAHAEGQLNALDDLGVESVGVAVEWATAGDDKVCKACAPLEGVILKIDEARGLIPRHPSCRCCFYPSGVFEDTEGQVATKQGIKDAIAESVDADGGDDATDWAGADATISKSRPESIFNETTDSPSSLERFSAWVQSQSGR